MSLQKKLEDILEKLKVKKPNPLNADDLLLDSNWNNVCASIALLTEAIRATKETPSSIPAVGSPYIRLPGMPLPWVEFSATLKNQWIAVHEKYPGVFLRLAGGNASSFKADSESVSYDTKAKGTGGGQMDAIQEHIHGINISSQWWGKNKGDWGLKDPYGNTDTYGIKNARSDIETRPKNITVEMYVFKG